MTINTLFPEECKINWDEKLQKYLNDRFITLEQMEMRMELFVHDFAYENGINVRFVGDDIYLYDKLVKFSAFGLEENNGTA